MTVVQTERHAYPHLTDAQWATLQRLARALGDHAAAAILALEPQDQINSVENFSAMEQTYLRAAHPSPQPMVVRDRPLKVHVSHFGGSEDDNLLAWLLEVETAILAAQISDEVTKVTYGISFLQGRAKKWAISARLANTLAFPTWEDFKTSIQAVFQPPKSEFRARTKFLALKQDRKDLHTFVQELRYLSACVVGSPIDEATKVSVFLNGLKAGPIRTQLFREYPETLEIAISRALEEEFSLKQARVETPSSFVHRQRSRDFSRARDTSRDMDLSSAERARTFTTRDVRCYRCGRSGHYANRCSAPRATGNTQGGRAPSPSRRARSPQGNAGRQ
jgi:hypothetical protein